MWNLFCHSVHSQILHGFRKFRTRSPRVRYAITRNAPSGSLTAPWPLNLCCSGTCRSSRTHWRASTRTDRCPPSCAILPVQPSSCRHCATKLASKFELSAKSKSWCQSAPTHNFRLKTTSSATMWIIYIILDINPADFLFTFFPLEPNVVGARSKSFDLFDLQLANWSKKNDRWLQTLTVFGQKKRPQLLSKFYFETKLCYQTSSTCTKQNKLRSSLKPLHWSFVKWSISKKNALIICKMITFQKKNGTDHL